MRVLWGRSVEGGAAVAFRPLTEALMSVLRRDSAVFADRPDLWRIRWLNGSVLE
jgi:hypothetical protein